MAKKRGCLGCSFPVLIIVLVLVFGLFFIAFAAGPVGRGFGLNLPLPEWLIVQQPAPELPPETVFHLGPLPVSNTMLAAWLTTVFLVFFSWLATRKMQVVPGRYQMVFEFLLGWVYNFSESVAGQKYVRRFFPLVCAIFLFVMFNAYLGLLPFFGAINLDKTPPASAFTVSAFTVDPPNANPGDPVTVSTTVTNVGAETGMYAVVLESDHRKVGESHVELEADHAEEVSFTTTRAAADDFELHVEKKVHLFRPANTDINVPLALAFISFVTVWVIGFKFHGFGYLNQFFQFGPFFASIGRMVTGRTKFDVMTLFNGAINIFVGLLEFLSQLIRLLSLTFRLFGNMTAGEILLLMMTFLVPFLVSDIFLGLELLIGFVQALIFGGLTLVYLSMAVASHGEEEHHEEAH